MMGVKIISDGRKSVKMMGVNGINDGRKSV
jgi:hypothetical protein